MNTSTIINYFRRHTAIRVLTSIVIGLLLALLISETTYHLNAEGTDRPPTRIELVIPYGTAEMVALGKEEPGLPDRMTFVQGDTLVVINQDTTSHQLGPVWVPANSTGSLLLDQVDEFSIECSFRPARYLGIEVRERPDLFSRIQAMLVLGLPMGGLLAVYSFLIQWNQPPDEMTKKMVG